MTIGEVLPAVNACLNATSALLLVAGFRAIRARRIATHQRFMVAAVATSAVFLACYLVRFYLTGTHRYPAEGWTRSVYLVVLGTHTVLAALVPFMVGRALWLAWKKRFPSHRRIARWLFPIWLYVSVTGVVVYLMLYHLAPARL